MSLRTLPRVASWLSLINTACRYVSSSVNARRYQAEHLTLIGLKTWPQGSLGGAAVWRLPLAQGAILETLDRIPHRAPGAWSLLLPLPVSLPLSLSLFDYHKKNKK